jgi:hypothetical protein
MTFDMWFSVEESFDSLFGAGRQREAKILWKKGYFFSEDVEQFVVVTIHFVQSIEDNYRRSIDWQTIGWT